MKSHYRNQGNNKIIQKNREPSFMDGSRFSIKYLIYMIYRLTNLTKYDRL